MTWTVATEAEVSDGTVGAFMWCHAAPHAPGGFLAASAAVTKAMVLEAPKRVGDENLHVFT